MALKSDIYTLNFDKIFYTRNVDLDIVVFMDENQRPKRAVRSKLQNRSESDIFYVITGLARHVFESIDGVRTVEEINNELIKKLKIPAGKKRLFLKKSMGFFDDLQRRRFAIVAEGFEK